MNTKKIVMYYGIFGCWTKFIPGVVGHIMFGIWLTMVLFWVIINAFGIGAYLLDKCTINKELIKNLTTAEMRVWHVNNLMAVCSYVICGEFLIALTFALTSGVFMFISEKEITKLQKKETKNKK